MWTKHPEWSMQEEKEIENNRLIKTEERLSKYNVYVTRSPDWEKMKNEEAKADNVPRLILEMYP